MNTKITGISSDPGLWENLAYTLRMLVREITRLNLLSRPGISIALSDLRTVLAVQEQLSQFSGDERNSLTSNLLEPLERMAACQNLGTSWQFNVEKVLDSLRDLGFQTGIPTDQPVIKPVKIKSAQPTPTSGHSLPAGNILQATPLLAAPSRSPIALKMATSKPRTPALLLGATHFSHQVRLINPALAGIRRMMR